MHAQQVANQSEKVRKNAYPIEGSEVFSKELAAKIEKKCKKFKVKNVDVKFFFTVEKDGTLNEIRILGDTGDFENELIKIFKSMPKWYPAIENNLPIRANYSIPIKIETLK